MEAFLRDPQGSHFGTGKQREHFFWNDGLDGRFLRRSVCHDWKTDGGCVHRKILIVIRKHRFLEGTLSELLVLAFGISDQFVFQD